MSEINDNFGAFYNLRTVLVLVGLCFDYWIQYYWILNYAQIRMYV